MVETTFFISLLLFPAELGLILVLSPLTGVELALVCTTLRHTASGGQPLALLEGLLAGGVGVLLLTLVEASSPVRLLFSPLLWMVGEVSVTTLSPADSSS